MTLYGDGIHDDFPAIQAMIDSGTCEVVLPAPRVRYLISQSLVLPSNFRLVLPRYAEIKLADGANCVMVRNQLTPTGAPRKSAFYDPGLFSAAPAHTVRSIEIVGGIWNCNNLGQNPNPIQTHVFEPEGYTGFGMLFFNVQNFKLASMTLKDPVNFAVTLDRVADFTVEDITFDFNYGNPNAVNMDGIHLNGNCHRGVIRNLKGACYDDLVALNADEGSDGPITDMQISGLFAEDCHSAVRLLTVKNRVENIRISDVYGTYYQCCIGLTKYYPGETTGYFDAITLDNICASKAERHTVYCKDGSYVYPLIWVQSNCRVRNLRVAGLHRREKTTPVETVFVGANAAVDRLILDHVTTQNAADAPMPLLVNRGTIGTLTMRDIDAGGDERIVNDGTIGRINEN